MLRKLLKYDLKWIYKPLIVFYILALAFSSIARGLNNIENSIVFTVLTQICYGTAIAMMINIIINNLMRCWARFIRNIYKDESYLTHTLPVKKQDIFLSKVLAGIITIISSFLIIGLCIVICYGTTNNINMLKELLTPIVNLIEIDICYFIIILISIFILEFIFILVAGYLGIILGHKSNNLKIVKSVIFGFLAFMVMSISTILLLFIVGLFNKNIMNLFNTTEAPNKETIRFMLLGGTILYCVYIVIYYIIGRTIIKHGVNIE